MFLKRRAGEGAEEFYSLDSPTPKRLSVANVPAPRTSRLPATVGDVESGFVEVVHFMLILFFPSSFLGAMYHRQTVLSVIFLLS